LSRYNLISNWRFFITYLKLGIPQYSIVQIQLNLKLEIIQYLSQTGDSSIQYCPDTTYSQTGDSSLLISNWGFLNTVLSRYNLISNWRLFYTYLKLGIPQYSIVQIQLNLKLEIPQNLSQTGDSSTLYHPDTLNLELEIPQ